MFELHIVDWADNTDKREYGLDLVTAYQEAVIWSKFGNTDYVILTNSGLPVLKFVDGEEVKVDAEVVHA